jgi:hypothetical protein
MLLTRVIVRRRAKDSRVFADYRTPGGRRVRIVLGNVTKKRELSDLVEAAYGRKAIRED